MKPKQDKKPKENEKNLVKKEELEEIHDNEEEAKMSQIETEGAKIPSVLPPYFPLRKLGSKPVKDPKAMKFITFTPLLLEKVPFEGKVLGKVPQLKMKDWDFNDRSKYLQFKPSKYLH